MRRRGQLEDIAPGVSALAGQQRTFRQRAIAVAWSANGFISHDTAARLTPLRGWSNSRALHVSVLHRTVRPLDGVTIHRRYGLGEDDVVGLDEGALISSPALTLLDIAYTANEFALRSAYHDAWHRDLIDPHRLIATIERLSTSGRSGGPRLRAVVDRYPIDGFPARSNNELLLYDAVYDDPALPNARLNHPVRRSTGRLAYVDVAWPEFCFGIEVDHTDTHELQWADDIRRTAELNGVGWTIDRLMEDHFTSGLAATVAGIGSRLRRHGWRS
jgi:hypothetical protein